MKSSLDHLPTHKQQELKTLVAALVAAFKNVEMVVLFGSYARGEQVEDTYIKDGGIYEYRSDFDLLIVLTNGGKENNAGFKHSVNEVLRKAQGQTPARAIIQGINKVNEMIEGASPLFSDIRRQGILLYSTGNFNLGNARKLKAQEVLDNAQQDFEFWIKRANDFLWGFDQYFKAERNNIAAFHLHQVTEHCYAAVLMVFTGYKAKDHDLDSLGTQVNELDRRFEAVFPRNSEEEKQRFNLLKAAYVDARYEKNYKITSEELEYLNARVVMLKELTEKVCGEKIEALRKVVSSSIKK